MAEKECKNCKQYHFCEHFDMYVCNETREELLIIESHWCDKWKESNGS